MANDVASDLGDEIPVFIGILNGSFMLVSDFVKKYPKPCEVTFIKLASYEGLKSSDDIQLTYWPNPRFNRKDSSDFRRYYRFWEYTFRNP